ncbi:hypothetical protein ScPMuIL_009988 [Solemya velum]
MSMIRGVTHDYSEGECVLCFEPDPTKARVLYDAKVLEATVKRESDGRRMPGYLIHFQGWNSSWDRVVGENHILKNTEENRILMKRLTEIARKYRVNKTRKKRIDEILKKAFSGQSSVLDSDSGSDSSDEDVEDDESGKKEDETDDDPVSENGDFKRNGHLHENDSDIKKQIVFEFDFPDTLKEKLDMDYFAINQDEKFVKLPAEPNIITILEGFVKTFSVNLLCSRVNKNRSNKDEPRIPFDRNIPMCKELADGLRICFDFTLPLILLYASEKDQYKRVSAVYKNKSPIKKDNDSSSHSVPSSPLPSPSPTKVRSLRFSISSTDEPSPKVPRMSSPRKKDKSENGNMPKLEETPPLTPRRLTRQTAHGSSRKSTDTPKTPTNQQTPDKKDEERKEPRRFELRSGRRHSGSSLVASSVKKEVLSSSDGETSDVDRCTPPPPLLIPSAISSTTKQNSQTATNSVDSSAEMDKEDIVDSVLTWKLLPPDIIDQMSSTPSLIYGAQHLLRLFVKLPDLIRKMNMPEKKLKALLKLMNSFLQYLAEREEELFPESVYVCAEDSVVL